MALNALRELPSDIHYDSEDALVIFGEVFDNGYVNGLIDKAKSAGMKVIFSTVGRRNSDGSLRSLSEEELKNKGQTPLINIPLEAGFDLEPSKNGGASPCDQLKGVKMSEWQDVRLNWEQVQESQASGVNRFKQATNDWVQALEEHIGSCKNILFAHTMAGGFPRAKVVMPATNRVFKGFGERYTSSKGFWESDIGKLCNISFNEVTGNTLEHLIQATTNIREARRAKDHQVSYVAYGYHGTEVLCGDQYQWQSYSPYLQGWAKLRLEEIAMDHFSQGVNVSVYNCPEILTQSSSIFLGVEVSLYPLMAAISKECPPSFDLESYRGHLQSLLKAEHSLEEIRQVTEAYLNSDTIRQWSDFKAWPQHNGPKQMEMMRTTSSQLIEMHKDTKKLITEELSSWVFQACGNLMLREGFKPNSPVVWLGHDIVAKAHPRLGHESILHD